jgi:hypothetical protein
LAVGLAGPVGCRASDAGPTWFYDSAWYASAQDKGAVWFFPEVDESGGWDESRVDRVRCPSIVPQYWCAPVDVLSTDPDNYSVYGTSPNGPFGVAITAKLPKGSFGIAVRNQSHAGMGIGVDCPAESRAFPVHPQSFTVVVTDSRAYRVELWTWRYCPATSILGVVSYALGREPARRALDLAAARDAHASMRIAALEALARSPDNDRCLEVHDLVRRIQAGDPSGRVRTYAKERWPAARLERARMAGRRCWSVLADGAAPRDVDAIEGRAAVEVDVAGAGDRGRAFDLCRGERETATANNRKKRGAGSASSSPTAAPIPAS